jgi:tetratricopeptide (TPR) repeat protein
MVMPPGVAKARPLHSFYGDAPYPQFVSQSASPFRLRLLGIAHYNLSVRTQTTLLLLTALSVTVSIVSADATTHTVPIDPKVKPLLKKAASEYKLKQYDLAIRTYSDALQMKPETTTASAIHSWRAYAYFDKGDWDKATNDATESIRLNPHYFNGYLARGIIYRRSGNLDQAIRCYNTSIRLNPNFARTYYDRAMAYGLKGDYDAAIRDYTEAIRRGDPIMEADFHNNRAVAYYAVGNIDKAIADYDKAIRLAPNDFRTYCGRAWTFEDMGELDKASADYDRVTRANATNTNGYVFRGTANFAKGNYHAAASDFEKAVALSPRDYDALCDLAWFQATCPEDSLRNGKAALEKARRACELTQWQHSDPVDTLAAAYADIGNFDDAIKYETRVINMKGVHAFVRKKMQERLELYRQHKPYRKESKFKAQQQ